MNVEHRSSVMEFVSLRGVRVSRFIIGGNPFSGFSHQSVEMDERMMRYYTTGRIKETLREAERLGINTVIARGDAHIRRLLMEYWDEGGTLQWFCQSCPELGAPANTIQAAIASGAKACYVHGGVMDYFYAQDKLNEVPAAIAMIREAGLLAGIAAHDPKVIEWAEEHLDVDFYMCCYYNPSARDRRPEHVHGAAEWFLPEDRDRMTALIGKLSRPAIHYKVLAAGRSEPAEAFEYVAKVLRPSDAVCVGVYAEQRADMLAEDVRLLLERVTSVKVSRNG